MRVVLTTIHIPVWFLQFSLSPARSTSENREIVTGAPLASGISRGIASSAPLQKSSQLYLLNLLEIMFSCLESSTNTSFLFCFKQQNMWITILKVFVLVALDVVIAKILPARYQCVLFPPIVVDHLISGNSVLCRLSILGLYRFLEDTHSLMDSHI